MSDLGWGALAVAGLTVAVFLLSVSLFQRLSPAVCERIGIGVVALLFFYIYELWYDVRLSRLLPFSNLILLGNWLPILAAVLAAIVWRKTESSGLRRVCTIGALTCAATFSFLYPLFGRPPECQNRWDKLGTCLQTTRSTCSPASAAMLLKQYGIETTEQEMAELCLTRDGTSWQGLYRGLKLKTAGTAYDVEVFRCDEAELRQRGNQPMLLSVGLSRSSPAATEFTREFGWQPGVNHSVVLLGFDANGNARIADPSLEMCREYWSPETFNTLWRGYAFRLVAR